MELFCLCGNHCNISQTRRGVNRSRGFMSRPGTSSNSNNNNKKELLQEFSHTDDKMWWCVYSTRSVQHICTMCMFITELLVKSWCLSWTALYWELLLICAPLLIHNTWGGANIRNTCSATPALTRTSQLRHVNTSMTVWTNKTNIIGTIKVEALVLDCIRLHKCS